MRRWGAEPWAALAAVVCLAVSGTAGCGADHAVEPAASLDRAREAQGSLPDGEDEAVRIQYYPANLWRDADGGETASHGARPVQLAYAFLSTTAHGASYADCPPTGDCQAHHREIRAALAEWQEASAGRILFTERQSDAQIFFSWVSLHIAARARAVDNSLDQDQPTPEVVDSGGRGFDRPLFPDGTKAFTAILFDADRPWYANDQGECPPAPSSDKHAMECSAIRVVALHELGHALGFGHFTNSGLMSPAGGSGSQHLAEYERDALRRLYDLFFAAERSPLVVQPVKKEPGTNGGVKEQPKR